MIEHPLDELALYAFGALEPRERESIARHLDSCAPCRAELATHERAVAALAESVEVAPRRDLRDAIVARHARFPLQVLPRLALAAALVVAVALGGLLASTRADLERAQRDRDAYAQALSAIAQGGRIVPLASRNTTGRGTLVLSRAGAPYLVLDLPAAPAGRTYQAWLIRDGVPRPMGLAPAAGGIVILPLGPEMRAGDLAAVTVEAAGGVDVPTSEPILAAGL